MTLRQVLGDPKLLGSHAAFRNNLGPWEPWLTFADAAYGLPLDESGEARFRRHTGRSEYDPPAGGWREAVVLVGRQAGKTQLAAGLVTFEAALAVPRSDGEVYALLIAQDYRAARRASLSYIRSLFESSSILRRMIVKTTSDTLRLSNGVNVAAYPCRPEAIRGLRAIVAVCDELAFFRSSEMIPQDREMLRALRPCLATTGGKLVVVSSPYGQSGALWDLHRRHHGRDQSPVLVWQASAPEMHPNLAADYLDRMREEDPEAYRSEVLGEFRTGLAQLLDPEAIQACVATGRLELPPVGGVEYQAFVDPSGGRRDAFTLSIGHRDGSGAVVDVCRAWTPPLNPSGVVAEAAELLKRYRVWRVTGDRYAGEWPREQFRSHGIAYQLSEKPKSDLYVEMLAQVNGARIELPDDPLLVRELRGLERRRGSSGRDRVDHAPGAHDDRANAVAGLAWMLLRKPESQAIEWMRY